MYLHVFTGAAILFHMTVTCHGYKPIIYMHGILGSYHEFDEMKEWIRQVS